MLLLLRFFLLLQEALVVVLHLAAAATLTASQAPGVFSRGEGGGTGEGVSQQV